MRCMCATSEKSAAVWSVSMMAGALAAMLDLMIRVVPEAKTGKNFIELTTPALFAFFLTSFI